MANNSITLEATEKLVRKLEDKIHGLLIDFYRETDCLVEIHRVDLEEVQSMTGSKVPPYVHIDARL